MAKKLSTKFQKTMKETEKLAKKMEKKYADIWDLIDNSSTLEPAKIIYRKKKKLSE